MIISHPQGLLITEVDLVLTEVALTLRVLDLQPRGLHCQANRANDVLDHRRAKNGVVDVVGIGWLEIAMIDAAGVGVMDGAGGEFEVLRRTSTRQRSE